MSSKNKGKPTEHHCVPRSRGGSEEECNRRNLPKMEHEAYHTIGANTMPHEVIFHIISINRTCFDPRFVEKMMRLLSRPIEEMYKPEAFVEEMRWEVRRRARKTLEEDEGEATDSS